MTLDELVAVLRSGSPRIGDETYSSYVGTELANAPDRRAPPGVPYAVVFADEALGLALCVPLLRAIDVETLAKDVADASARRSAAAMGWVASRLVGRQPIGVRILDDRAPREMEAVTEVEPVYRALQADSTPCQQHEVGEIFRPGHTIG